MSRIDRITIDAAICHGQPTIRGLRYTVESVLELLAADVSIDEVLADYPDLERDDVLAALEFGARASGRRGPIPSPRRSAARYNPLHVTATQPSPSRSDS